MNSLSYCPTATIAHPLPPSSRLFGARLHAAPMGKGFFLFLLLACLQWGFGWTPALALGIGDRIRTTADLNVRPSPGGTPAYPNGQPANVFGVIVDGPIEARIGGTGTLYRWWRVNFDTGQDGWVADLNLTGAPLAAAAPRLDRVDPATPVANADNSDQFITLIGGGFGNPATVIFGWTGQSDYVMPASRVERISSTQLRVRLRLGAEADSWSVRVRNPDGQQSPVRTFQVLAPVVSKPAPTVTAVRPEPLRADSANAFQEIEILGTGFSNPSLLLGWTGMTGYRLPASRVLSATSSRIVISIKLGAEADAWTVQVVNDDGKSSNLFPFAVLAPTVLQPAPVITGVAPEPLVANAQNAYQTVRLLGRHFTPGLTVVLGWTGLNEYVLTPSRVTFVSESEIALSIRLGAEADQWTVQLRRSDGTRSAVFPFEVLAPVIEPPPVFALSLRAENGVVDVHPELAEYASGTVVQIEARPNPGYAFAGWAGDLSGEENPASLVMDGPRSVVARFIPLAPPAPGHLTPVRISKGVMELELTGTAGRSYRILGSTDLHDWTPLTEIAVPASGSTRFSLPMEDPDQSFFQAELVP